MDNTERNAEIIRRRLAGEGPRSIARAMGLTAQTVAGALHRAGLTKPTCGRGNGPTDEVKAYAKSLCRTMTQAEAGARLGVAQQTISAWLAA